MEKIRYGGTIFELVPGGFDAFSEDKLTIRHQKGDKTLGNMGNSRFTYMTLLINPKKGYFYAYKGGKESK